MSQTPGPELKIYEVTNKNTGEKHYSVSDNAQDACKQAGWNIGDCYVNPQKPRRSLDADTPSQLLVKIPCQTCPFQFGECRKPATEECPTRPQTPDIYEWTKWVLEAHQCPYVGQELSKTDYHLGQKWVPMEQAMEDLGDHDEP